MSQNPNSVGKASGGNSYNDGWGDLEKMGNNYDSYLNPESDAPEPEAVYDDEFGTYGIEVPQAEAQKPAPQKIELPSKQEAEDPSLEEIEDNYNDVFDFDDPDSEPRAVYNDEFGTYGIEVPGSEKTEEDVPEPKLSDTNPLVRKIRENLGLNKKEQGAGEDPDSPVPVNPEEPVNPDDAPKQITGKVVEPIVAVELDANRIADAYAREQAEKRFQTEIENAGFFKRIWKGNYAKNYYLEKYRREARADLSGLKEEDYQATLQRFQDAALNDFGNLIHDKAGESLFEENEAMTNAVKELAKWYATTNLKGDELAKECKTKKEEIKKLLFEQNGGANADQINFTLNNYDHVLEQVKTRYDSSKDIELVLEGFRVINGRAVEGARTEAHHGAFEKLANRWESSEYGRLVPTEVVVGAASVFAYAMQSGVSKLASVLLPVGGSLVSGAVAGIRESGHIKEDRANMARDKALGRERKGGKYDDKIEQTLQQMESATDLMGAIDEAMSSGDSDALKKAIFEAQSRIDFSDMNQVDLIAYSSPENSAQERYNLDMKVRTALETMRTNGEDIDFVNRAREAVYKQALGELENSVEEKDKSFGKLARRQIFKQSAKTALASFASLVISQEVLAFFNENSVGLIENMVGKTTNSENAQNTMLAGFANLQREHQINYRVPVKESYTPKSDSVNLNETGFNNHTSNFDQGELAEYIKGGSNPAVGFKYNGIASGPGLKDANLANVGSDGSLGDGRFLKFLYQGTDARGNTITKVFDMQNNNLSDPEGFLSKIIGQNGEVNGDYLRVVATNPNTGQLDSVATVLGNGSRPSFTRTVFKDAVKRWASNPKSIIGGVRVLVGRNNLSSVKEGASVERPPAPTGGEGGGEGNPAPQPEPVPEPAPQPEPAGGNGGGETNPTPQPESGTGGGEAPTGTEAPGGSGEAGEESEARTVEEMVDKYNREINANPGNYSREDDGAVRILSKYNNYPIPVKQTLRGQLARWANEGSDVARRILDDLNRIEGQS